MYLICDFDGTLFINDFFEEKFFKLCLEQPWEVVRYGLQKNGLLRLKHKLLDDFVPEYDVDFLINAGLLAWLKTNSKNYRETILLSASTDIFVKNLAEPMAVFNRIHGSLNRNLAGRNKLSFIRESGLLPFAYMGDSKADKPIFDAADQAFLVTSHEIKQLK